MHVDVVALCCKLFHFFGPQSPRLHEEDGIILDLAAGFIEGITQPRKPFDRGVYSIGEDGFVKRCACFGTCYPL